ncbi:MAG: hypothetical protein H6546_02625 [Chitinophagales bacterium]|nr:hypothetical protein [Chitinophagales bacterium]
MISGGFKAPGSEGLRKSLEKIESLLDKVTLSDSPVPFEDIVAYDIFMHLADSVLSGGVRRSATIVMFGDHQEKMVNAKTGNWFNENPQRARSNNSVMIPSDISKEELRKLLNINDGTSDLGFVRVENIYSVYNPCAEIKFSFFDQIKNKNSAVFSFCNLCEINAEGNKDAAEFYEACVAASVIGTIQASFTHFPYLGEETSRVVEGEALLGVSVTGWMNAPWLFDEKILLNGVDEVKATNHLVSLWLGINPSARLTCVKPSGNASALLGTSSGIHAEHSRRFFRIMQLNKESTVAKWLEASMPEVLEESQWSATNSDYVVYVPVTIADNAITKEDLTAIDHLEKVKLVQRNWVLPGKVEERCYDRSGSHNVSVTVIVDDMAEVVDYMHENLSDFTAVSFLPRSGDRDYVQAPFTSVKTSEEIYKEYGDAAMLASGLVVDGLHVFSNLWRACDHVTQRDLKFEGTRYELVLQKDWVRRAKKFAKNFFKGNLERMILCLKDVHLLHKWHTVNRTFKVPDLGTLLDEPEYVAADTLAAAACHGGKCDI